MPSIIVLFQQSMVEVEIVCIRIERTSLDPDDIAGEIMGYLEMNVFNLQLRRNSDHDPEEFLVMNASGQVHHYHSVARIHLITALAE